MTHPNQLPAILPPGCEIVERGGTVRLGPGGPTLLVDDYHASVGIVSVEATTDGYLKVTTDFDPETETCWHAGAKDDATLAAKGIFVGASGGAAVTLFSIHSSRALPYGTQGAVRAAYSRLHPSGGVFDHNIDNLWLTFKSVRQITP